MGHLQVNIHLNKIIIGQWEIIGIIQKIRELGVCTFDHVVGKPLFIWFSLKNGNFSEGINWKRIFTSTNKL